MTARFRIEWEFWRPLWVPVDSHDPQVDRPVNWLLVSSWRIRFSAAPVLEPYDVRIHKHTNRREGWVISEASTGGAMVLDPRADYPSGAESLCEWFVTEKLPRITPEMMVEAVTRGRQRNARFPAPVLMRYGQIVTP